MHMLIATDGSRTAADAAHAVDLFKPVDQVTLLTVLTSLPGENIDELEDLDEPGWTPEEQARKWEVELREANRELARTADVLSIAHVETRVDAGDVAQTICRVAREIGADIVVLGKSRRHGLRHALRRSIAERVVHDVPCIVLVVPEQENADPA